jgi:cyclopropane-fatty-acyl-phospholipid synthase
MSQVELGKKAGVLSSGFLARSGRRAVRALLCRLERGAIEWNEGSERLVFGNPDSSLRAVVTLHDSRAYAKMFAGGSVGAAEAYADGWWSSPDPAAVVRVLLRNVDLADGLDGGFSRIRGLAMTLLRPLRDNTRRGSRRNIAAHYDLGNDFFAEFLDATMTYSCGVFERPESTLAEASEAKLDLICRKLGLGRGSEILEIGTGWGSFAIHAAERYGCRVVTTTISPSQHTLAKQRVSAAGLGGRIDLLQVDYRDLPRLLHRRFDHLVSVEMIEAVGHRHLDRYFNTCASLLKDDGTMLLQAILIDDRRQASHRRRPDFIMRHIFPGACLPSQQTIARSIARATDLTVRHLHDLTPHYSRTLRAWRRRLLRNRTRVAAHGYPDRLVRLWDFYLAYCEAGFEERYIGDAQYLLARPGARLDLGVSGQGWRPA